MFSSIYSNSKGTQKEKATNKLYSPMDFMAGVAPCSKPRESNSNPHVVIPQTEPVWPNTGRRQRQNTHLTVSKNQIPSSFGLCSFSVFLNLHSVLGVINCRIHHENMVIWRILSLKSFILPSQFAESCVEKAECMLDWQTLSSLEFRCDLYSNDSLMSLFLFPETLSHH